MINVCLIATQKKGCVNEKLLGSNGHQRAEVVKIFTLYLLSHGKHSNFSRLTLKLASLETGKVSENSIITRGLIAQSIRELDEMLFSFLRDVTERSEFINVMMIIKFISIH